MFFSLAVASTQAANITTTQSGNWEAGTTWAGGVPPGSGDNVTIASSHLVAVPMDAAAATITIAANTSGTNGIAVASGVRLNVSGAINMTAPTYGTSTISVGAGMLNAASIAIPGSGTAGRNCVVSVSTGVITITGSISFTGTAAQAQFVSTDASTLNIGGNFESGGTLTTSGTGTINFNGNVAQTIGTYTTYNNISISNTSGGVTLTGTTTIGGNLTVMTGTFAVGPYALTASGTTYVSGTFSITSATGAKAFTNNIIINSGGIWNNSTGNAAVSMGGNLQNDGTFIAGTGAYTFTGAAKAISGVSSVSIPNLTVNGTVTNNGTLIVSTALAGSGTLTNDAYATLSIGGTVTITTLTATASPNTVSYSGAAQTVRAIAYHHLTLSGSGAKTLTNVGTINGNLTLSGTSSATTAIATTIGGNLSIGSNASFTVAAFPLTVTAATFVSGTLAISSATGAKTFTGLVTINSGGSWTNTGNSAITFQGGITYNGATFSSGTGVYAFASNSQTVEGGSALVIGNVIADGITLTNNSTNLIVSTALSGTGELAQGAGATLTIGGTSGITTLTAIASPNTVNYSGAAQTVKSTTYHHLTLSGSGAKTLTDVGTTNGNLTLSGTCSAATAIATTISGNLSIGSNASFTVAAFPLTVTAATFVSGTLAISSATGAKTFTGLVTINSGGSWTNTGSSAITFQGGLTHNGTTFSSGTGVYTFDTNPQTVQGGSALTITNVTVNGITLTNNSTNFIISTALSGIGELAQGAGATLNIGGTSGITTLTATASPNTVNYSGAAQTVKPTTYHHLTLSGSGVKTLTNVSTINGNLIVAGTTSGTAAVDINIGGSFTVDSSASFATGAFTLDLKGGFINNNIFMASGGEIMLTGTTDQAISGSTNTIFNDLTINKAGGAVMVSTNFAVSGMLTFTGGNINTGAGVVIITLTGSVSRTSGHVVGNLRKQVSAGSPSQIFEVGVASSYCPLSVSFYGITSSGDLTARVTTGDHPNTASSTIGTSLNVNNYWTLVNSGIIFTNYDATFSFNPGDIDPGANANLFKVGGYDAGVWLYPAIGMKTDTSTEAVALAGFGDFSLGQDRPDPPVLAPIDSQSVSEGDTLTFSVSATDPDSDSLILFVDTLPTNASYSDNGNGTGTFIFGPNFTQAGVYNVTFVASDGSLADSEVVAITVIDAGNQRPMLASIGEHSVSEGDTVAFGVGAADPDGDSLILWAENLPVNADFSDNGDGTGNFDFSPNFTQAGVYSVTFIASDGALADSETVTITVIFPDSVTISGNAGVGGAILSYIDGTTKSDTADGSGNYSFSIPYDWSGIVTPSKTGHGFTPSDRTYANVTSNQVDQDFAASLILDVVEDVNSLVPDEFHLAQNYPNPFNPSTVIHFAIPRTASVSLKVYNIIGQEVADLFEGSLSAGSFWTTWDGTDMSGQAVSSGIYLYRLKAGDYVEIRKMLLMK